MAAFLLGPSNPVSKLRPLIPVRSNMTARDLRNGTRAYYWRAPRSVERLGLPLHSQPLGSNFVEAVQTAIKLNRLYAECKRAKKSKEIGMH